MDLNKLKKVKSEQIDAIVSRNGITTSKKAV